MSEIEREAQKEIIAALADCEDKVDHLTRENTLLRDASRTFGALAERLNQTLESERRLGSDRRAKARPTADRRQTCETADSTLVHAGDTPHNGTPRTER